MDRRDFFGVIAAPLLRRLGPAPVPTATKYVPRSSFAAPIDHDLLAKLGYTGPTLTAQMSFETSRVSIRPGDKISVNIGAGDQQYEVLEVRGTPPEEPLSMAVEMRLL